MSNHQNLPKFNANKFLILEGNKGSSSDLITIKTTKKKEIIKEIVENISSWMNNPNFEHLKNKPLDAAIVIYVDKSRMKRQDIDNVAKIVLDALKKSKKNIEKPYLFEDDAQIIRLLIYKQERNELNGYETSSIVISYREHDPNKQMILVEGFPSSVEW
jgi:Holliday junction resolvase RusA-like endonuclease